MAGSTLEFGKTGKAAEPGGRLDSPAFHRNHEPIWSAVGPYLGTRAGDVLELGSGTGQHAAAFARRTPRLAWWPSDVNPAHLASIAAWRAHAGLANLRAPQRIDLGDRDWTWMGDGADRLTAMLCINVLHIAPWAVSQNLFAGAGRLLNAGGWLFLYGPFMRGGAHTAPSNERFDRSLRAENPDWGVRDIRDLAALARDAGLPLTQSVAMPANNQVLVFTRDPRED
jgi:SAM-dependent methyltransferase